MARFLVLPLLLISSPAALTLVAMTPIKFQTPAENQQGKDSDSETNDRQEILKSVQVKGKAVDDETGDPIPVLITQAGKFDPSDPSNIKWGYSEGRSSRRDGSFSTTIRWSEGWTARVLADGYLPHPIISEAPPPGKERIEVTLRLKRGPTVRARVVDHHGEPLKGAAVFANGATPLNLYQGKAWRSWGDVDEAAKPAYTDEQGMFELQLGSATRLGISHTGLDAWAAEIPEGEETEIRLPEPAQVEFAYDIDGADADGEIFYQMLGHDMSGFKGLESTRTVPIKNGGTLVLNSLTPGKYQFARYKMLRLVDMGIGTMLEREYVELKPGEKKTIRYVRDHGARLRGRIRSPEGVELSGIIVTVQSVEKKVTPISREATATKCSSLVTAEDGDYRTERIAPGKYVLQAAAYEVQTETDGFFSGIRVPGYRTETTVTVPESGELKVPDLKLEKAVNDF